MSCQSGPVVIISIIFFSFLFFSPYSDKASQSFIILCKISKNTLKCFIDAFKVFVSSSAFDIRIIIDFNFSASYFSVKGCLLF